MNDKTESSAGDAPELKILSAEEILGADDLPMELVDLPEWGGAVYVRTMTGEERDDWEQTLFIGDPKGKGGKRKPNFKNVRARLVARTACNEARAPIFTAGQVEKLGKKNAAALDRCFSVAQQLNGITAKDVEDAEKNSEIDPGGDG